jgi:hypothetical protein
MSKLFRMESIASIDKLFAIHFRVKVKFVCCGRRCCRERLIIEKYERRRMQKEREKLSLLEFFCVETKLNEM